MLDVHESRFTHSRRRHDEIDSIEWRQRFTSLGQIFHHWHTHARLSLSDTRNCNSTSKSRSNSTTNLFWPTVYSVTAEVCWCLTALSAHKGYIVSCEQLGTHWRQSPMSKWLSTKINTFVKVEMNRRQSRPNWWQFCWFGRLCRHSFRLFAYSWATEHVPI